MNFDEYQAWTVKTVQHNDRPTPLAAELMYLGLGLAGEFGEVANQVKKIHRDDEGVLTGDRRANILEEAGDGLWYLARVLSNCGITLTEVMDENVAKLERRLANDTIKGDRREEFVEMLVNEIGPAGTIVDRSAFPSLTDCSLECERQCPTGIRCCEACEDGKPTRIHTKSCDNRQLAIEKRRDVAVVLGDLGKNSPAVPLASSLGIGMAIKAAADAEEHSVRSKFYEEDDEDEEDDGNYPTWFVRLTPSKGIMKGRAIIRQFSSHSEDRARFMARRMYGSSSLIHAISKNYAAVVDQGEI